MSRPVSQRRPERQGQGACEYDHKKRGHHRRPWGALARLRVCGGDMSWHHRFHWGRPACWSHLPRALLHRSRTPHSFGMVRPGDSLLCGYTVEFGMQIEAALASILVLLDRQRMGLGKSVLADAADLPRDVHVRPVCLDSESVVRNPAAHDSLRELPQSR